MAGSLLVAPASAAEACSSVTSDGCDGYLVCVTPHRDEAGHVRYCDTSVFWP